MNEPKCIVCSTRLDGWSLRFTPDHNGPLCGPCMLVYGSDPSPAAGESVDISQDSLEKR
jgi:hypothetical protein